MGFFTSKKAKPNANPKPKKSKANVISSKSSGGKTKTTIWGTKKK